MKPLSRKINLLLILVLSISLFVFAGGITIYLKISKSAQIHQKMQSSLAEYTSTLEKGIDEYMDGFCVFFKHLPAVDPSSYNRYLKGSVGINDYVTTLSEADGNGIILYSSEDSFMGTPVHESGWAGDMYFRSGQLEGSERLFEVGVSREDYDKEFQEYEKEASLNWNVGNDGFILICDESGNITAGNRDHYKGVTLSAEDTVKVTGMADTEEMGVITVSDRMCLMCSANGRGQYILSLYPADALKSDIYGTINMMVLSALLLMIIIYFFLKYLLRKTVVDEMGEINASLKKITEGDLEVRTNVRSSLEMSELSDGINITVDKLGRKLIKKYPLTV